MNFYKVFAVFAVLLSLCNYEAEGGLTLLLLLKLVALKGALFLGAPLAFGSFLLGQGIGFLGGSVLGGYTILGAVNKLNQKKKEKAAADAKATEKPAVVINQGWGAAPVGTVQPVVVKHIVKATAGGWGWKAPKKPSLLARITGIPGTIIRHYTRPKHVKKVVVEAAGWGWPSHDHHHHHHHDHHDHAHAHDHHGWTDAHAHADHGWTDSHAHAGHGWTDAHSHAGHGWSEGQGWSDAHSHHDTTGWVETKGDGWGWAPEEQGSEWTSSAAGGYETQGGYSSSTSGSSGSSGGYADSGYTAGGSSGRSIGGGYGAPSLISEYGPPSTSASSSSGGYSSFGKSKDSYERRSGDATGEATEEVGNIIPAPSAVMEEYLEKKLQQEIQTTKSESRKKEATQLMTMLREVYIQELANTVLGDKTTDGPTTALPPFLPMPKKGDAPNSTTMKPSTVEVTTLTPPGRSKLRNPFTKQNSKFVPIMETSFALQKQGIHKNHQFTPTDSQGLKTFKEDVRKFFLLVSLLDQDSCLQKMICDVHAKSGDGKMLSMYEKNIVTTFQVMNAVISERTEDSTAPYRKAGKIGENSKSLQTCASTYSSCTYSTEQIIKMGNQVSLNKAIPTQSP